MKLITIMYRGERTPHYLYRFTFKDRGGERTDRLDLAQRFSEKDAQRIMGIFGAWKRDEYSPLVTVIDEPVFALDAR